MKLHWVILKLTMVTSFFSGQAIFANTFFDGGEGVKIEPNVTTVFVTHPVEKYDQSAASVGINQLVAIAKKNKWSVIVLNDYKQGGLRGAITREEAVSAYYSPKTYLADIEYPLAFVDSISGEHRVPSKTSRLLLAGGYFSACLLQTFVAAVGSAFEELEKVSESTLQEIWVFAYIVVDAIYVSPMETLSELPRKPEAHEWARLLQKFSYKSWLGLVEEFSGQNFQSGRGKMNFENLGYKLNMPVLLEPEPREAKKTKFHNRKERLVITYVQSETLAAGFNFEAHEVKFKENK